MKLFSSAEQVVLEGGWGGVICVGNFDGLHLGHTQLLSHAKARGPLLVLTFEPHPIEILFPERAPKRIVRPERKLALLAAQGVSAVVVQPFDAAFAARRAAEFERLLFADIGARVVVVGANFTYGARREGGRVRLAEAGQRLGAEVDIFAEQKIGDHVVSSSAIRHWVSEGDVESARRYLGRPFMLEGKIVQGERRGGQMGFPTANLDCGDILHPKPGVYAVEFALDADGHWHHALANFGHKPTFGDSTQTHAQLEVHVLGASGHWYGQKATVRFVRRLREERRFASVEALKEQIRADIAAARFFLKP